MVVLGKVLPGIPKTGLHTSESDTSIYTSIHQTRDNILYKNKERKHEMIAGGHAASVGTWIGQMQR